MGNNLYLCVFFFISVTNSTQYKISNDISDSKFSLLAWAVYKLFLYWKSLNFKLSAQKTDSWIKLFPISGLNDELRPYNHFEIDQRKPSCAPPLLSTATVYSFRISATSITLFFFPKKVGPLMMCHIHETSNWRVPIALKLPDCKLLLPFRGEDDHFPSQFGVDDFFPFSLFFLDLKTV